MRSRPNESSTAEVVAGETVAGGDGAEGVNGSVETTWGRGMTFEWRLFFLGRRMGDG